MYLVLREVLWEKRAVSIMVPASTELATNQVEMISFPTSDLRPDSAHRVFPTRRFVEYTEWGLSFQERFHEESGT